MSETLSASAATGYDDPELGTRRAALATAVLGGVMLVMGGATLVQALRLDNGGDVVGPATAPWVIGTLSFVVGALMILRGRRDLTGVSAGEAGHAQDWSRLGLIVVVILAFAVAVPVVGYVVGATLLFGTTAVVLGAPHRVRSFAYGWCVATLVFLVFDVLIGISLPAGPWGF